MSKVIFLDIDFELLCTLYNELYRFNKKEKPDTNVHEIPYMKRLLSLIEDTKRNKSEKV